MGNAESFMILNNTYQVADLIKKTAAASFYYGFHLRMKKEILIVISHVPIENNISGLDELQFLPYVIDQWQDGENYYAVFNYIRGVLLEQYAQQNRQFTDKEIISAGLQICDILDEFERKNILAAEIWRLDNVMLTPDFRVCFLDGSSLSQMRPAGDVSKENIKAAVSFLRALCQGKGALFSKILNGNYKKVSQLRKNLLDIIKKTPAYKKMKWKQRAAYAVICCFFIGSVILLSKNALLYWEDSMLKEGDAAFQEREYEQAIINYQNVLSIDSGNIAARRGIAESYWNEGNMEKAEECFQKNVNDFQDDIGKAYLLQIRENKALNFFEAGNYEEALELYLELEEASPKLQYEKMLLNIYLKRNDFERAKSLIQELRSQEMDDDFMAFVEETDQMLERSGEASASLCELADLIAGEEWLALSDKIRTEEFTQLCEKYGGDTYCRYQDNVFVKLYKNGAIYFGEMDQDKRCGQGKWILLSKSYNDIIIFDGLWSNDLPNGKGTQKAVIIPYLREGRQIWLSMEGNYVNGYSDGEFFVQEYEEIGTEKNIFRSMTWKSTMGYLEPLSGYGDGTESPGYYIVGKWDNGDYQYTHYNHVDSVAGLGFSECFFEFDKEVDE